MKKLLLACISIIGLSATAQAQQSAFGLRAGLNLARYAGSDSRGGGSLAGGLAGLTVTSTFNQAGHTALQLELLYSGKGTKIDDPKLYVSQRLHYFDMPVLLQLRPGKVELEAGPQFGLLVAQKTDLTDKSSYRIAGSGTAGFKTLQVGYILGVGYRLPEGLGFGMRYNGAVTSIDGSSLRNSVFQFQLSYVFGPMQPGRAAGSK